MENSSVIIQHLANQLGCHSCQIEDFEFEYYPGANNISGYFSIQCGGCFVFTWETFIAEDDDWYIDLTPGTLKLTST